MGALADIERAVEGMLRLAEREIGQPLSPAAVRWAKETRLIVKIGDVTRRAILAETGDPELPETIDGVRLKLTGDFPGFQVDIL